MVYYSKIAKLEEELRRRQDILAKINIDEIVELIRKDRETR